MPSALFSSEALVFLKALADKLDEEKSIRVYNLYNDCAESKVFSDIESFAGKRRPVAVYAVGTHGGVVKNNKEI